MRRSVPGQKPKSKRRSVPGGRNLENKNEKSVEKGQITTGRHLKQYPMTYGKSLASGRRSGGYYWNPPADCISNHIRFDPENGEQWLDVVLCRACVRHKKNTCEAHEVKCGYEQMR